jgi:L-asparaginase
MRELTDDPEMPQVVAHEYAPLIDSSDMGPGDWALLAKDIETNYYHFDGFVILMVRISHTATRNESCKCMSHSISRVFVNRAQIQWHMQLRHFPSCF